MRKAKIIIESPFKGVSLEGIYIGMHQNDALTTMQKKYLFRANFGDSKIFSKSEIEKHNTIQFWFEENKLVKMKIFKY